MPSAQTFSDANGDSNPPGRASGTASAAGGAGFDATMPGGLDHAAGSDATTGGRGARASAAPPDAWRYTWHQNHLWYYHPSGQWSYWNSNHWTTYRGAVATRTSSQPGMGRNESGYRGLPSAGGLNRSGIGSRVGGRAAAIDPLDADYSERGLNNPLSELKDGSGLGTSGTGLGRDILSPELGPAADNRNAAGTIGSGTALGGAGTRAAERQNLPPGGIGVGPSQRGRGLGGATPSGPTGGSGTSGAGINGGGGIGGTGAIGGAGGTGSSGGTGAGTGGAGGSGSGAGGGAWSGGGGAGGGGSGS